MTEREACYLHDFRKTTFPISKHGSLLSVKFYSVGEFFQKQ